MTIDTTVTTVTPALPGEPVDATFPYDEPINRLWGMLPAALIGDEAASLAGDHPAALCGDVITRA
jgi:hypothetical protein